MEQVPPELGRGALRIVNDIDRGLARADLLTALRDLESACAIEAQVAGRGSRGLALNVAKTAAGNGIALLEIDAPRAEILAQARLAWGWIVRAAEGAPVGSG